MRLDQLSAAIRPRSNWEAMDLGVALLRRDALAVYGAWFAITGPIALVFLVAGFLTSSLIPLFLFWWLKPVYDRIVLHVLSQSLFGAKPRVRDSVKAAPGFLGGWLFAALIWRRLDLGRAFNLPVWQLEGLRGAAVRGRLAVLNPKARGSAIGAAIVCMHLVVAIEVAVLGLILVFLPAEWVDYQDVFSWLFLGATPASGAVVFLVYYLAETIIEPFFVASGFGLYLGRRTQLEAWDLELAFRKLALKLAPALGAVLVCFSLLPPPVLAADEGLEVTDSWDAALEAAPDYWSRRVESGRLTDSQAWVQEAQEIHTDTLFGYRDEGWELKSRDESADESAEDFSGLANWMATLGDALSILLELLLWVGAAAIAFFAARFLWLQRDSLQLSDRPEEPEVLRLELADGDTLALPADIAAAAARALDSGDTVLAISLLYRGALEHFQGQGLELPSGATEAECLRYAAAVAGSDQIDLFRRIVHYWQSLAYADEELEADAVRAVLRGWRPAFGVPE